MLMKEITCGAVGGDPVRGVVRGGLTMITTTMETAPDRNRLLQTYTEYQGQVSTWDNRRRGVVGDCWMLCRFAETGDSLNESYLGAFYMCIHSAYQFQKLV
mmetsp:Transcript_29038/g.40158  ORF Transcript_29038/g.40158 Transcript_29038/m.40158 type:complete len:101 (-) Transcript_29038:24-326(-)